MREILFRGKRKDNGEWVFGFVTMMWGQIHIVDIGNENTAYLVIPETVGQYTGVTDDRNGKKIFEGDIVKVYIKGCCTICTVGWAENVAHFQLWQINTIPKTPTHLDLGNYDCEVIGNIHDNPELMRGEE